MSKVTVFNFTTLNGFFKGPEEDISWHTHGMEENDFAGEMLQKDNILLFGRVTYKMMASYWPTPAAMEMYPVVAEGMNRVAKIVFSQTLKTVEWNNTQLVKDDLVETVRKLKQQPGKDMTILGSGSIVTQLADAGLIDSYGIMIDPVVIGSSTPLFQNLKQKLNLTLISTKTLASGVVLLVYQTNTIPSQNLSK